MFNVPRLFAAVVVATSVNTTVTTAEQAPSKKLLGVVLAVGDIMQCNEFKPRAVATAKLMRDEIATLKDTAVRVVLLGDLAYPAGSEADFKCFADNWDSVVRSALKDPNREILPIVGNHEYVAPPKNAAEFFKHFANNAAIRDARERASENDIKTGNFGYFATRFPDTDGGWLLLGLNSHLPSESARSAQYGWLKQQLTSPTGQAARCVLALWHDPVFSSGMHGHDGISPDKAPIRKKKMLHSYTLLYQSGASVVLNGHDHNYEQFLPHNHDGKRADDGLRSFVVGTGGNYIPDENWKRWPNITDGPMEKKVDGFLRLDLYEDSYTWRFVPVPGTPICGERAGQGNCNKRKPLV